VVKRAARIRDRAGVGAATGALLAGLILIAGCSSTGPKAGVDKFAGTWTFDSGMLQAMCQSPIPPFSSDLAGQTLTLAKGTTSDLMSTLTTMLGSCSLKLSVAGTMASADSGQTCTFNVPLGGSTIPVTVAVTTWTATTTDGVTMTTAVVGAVMGGIADGCPVTLNGTATKRADADASAG
jgi:hypothetical protein